LNVPERALMLPAVATIGENLERIRKMRFATKSQFARAIGASPSQVNDWESSRANSVDSATLLRWAKELDVSVDEFFVGVDFRYDEVRSQLPTLEFLAHFIQTRIDDEREADLEPPGNVSEEALDEADAHMRMCFHHLHLAHQSLGNKKQKAAAIASALHSLSKAFNIIDGEKSLLKGVDVDVMVRNLPNARDEFDQIADRLRRLKDASDRALLLQMVNQLIEGFERHRPRKRAVKKTA